MPKQFLAVVLTATVLGLAACGYDEEQNYDAANADYNAEEVNYSDNAVDYNMDNGADNGMDNGTDNTADNTAGNTY